MNNFWIAFAGSLASGTIALFIFIISSYLNLRKKRKTYLYKKIDVFNDFIYKSFIKKDKYSEDDLYLECQKPLYIFETQVLSSEAIIIEDANKKNKKHLNHYQIKKIKSVFFLNKNFKKKSLRCISTIHHICINLYYMKRNNLSIDEINIVKSTISFLIRELIANFKKATISGSNEFKSSWRNYYTLKKIKGEETRRIFEQRKKAYKQSNE